MIEKLLESISTLSTGEVKDVLTSAGESMLMRYKESCEWKKLFVDIGRFFINNENEETSFFRDLKIALSDENLSQIAKSLNNEDGYDLKHKLYDSLMKLMRKYEIPYEIAEAYTMKIIYVLFEQLRIVNPSKYEHFFLKEWKEEQDKNTQALQNRIEKISNELKEYSREKIAISSSGQLDIELRRSTCNPSIGIEFFIIDDERFRDDFEDKRNEELVYVKGRNREETIYCVLNELWRLNDKRPIYIVKNKDSWDKLQSMASEGNIYIPWFYADEIVAIENNTNIFAVNEDDPVFKRDILELRPRTQKTLVKCLQEAGMGFSDAYELLEDTHGLYTQIKKKVLKGELLKTPLWINNISDRAKKTCLLIGSWEENEGDKLVVESLYGGPYNQFIEEVIPYTKGEDSFLYVRKRNGNISYHLSSTENAWSYLDVSIDEPIWKNYLQVVFEVINESENLFTYDHSERMHALFTGEKLFWSETIRKGMLKSLLIKGAYRGNAETQCELDHFVETLLKNVNSEKQWIYISRFWKELCEISPEAILKRCERELNNNTGLLNLFQHQSSDFIFGRNSYINILWGIEQFLAQTDYFWQAFRLLLKLDSYNFEFKSNSTKDVILKVFCTWMNFSAIQKVDEKMIAANVAFEIDYAHAWEYLYSSINSSGTIIGELSYPKYRMHENAKSVFIWEMQKTNMGYLELLLKHMEFSVERWKKIIDLSVELPSNLKDKIFKKLKFEISQMSDEEVTSVKNEIRHLIYCHRYYSLSEWTMHEDKILEYENLLNDIKIKTPEYEYSYLFVAATDYPLLNPVPYKEGTHDKENESATQILIQEKLAEFKERGYSVATLAKICAQIPYTTLGRNLAKYWNKGKWNHVIFNELRIAQETGTIAIDYLENINYEEQLPFSSIIDDLIINGCSKDLLISVYRIDAERSKELPLVSSATEYIKREFWKNPIHCDMRNNTWAINECRKYATLDVYLAQIHHIHYRKPLSADTVFEYLDHIENLPRSSGSQMTSYHIEQLIKIVQDEFIDDAEKCPRIAQIEILFMNLLNWDSMKCFCRMINFSPILYAQIVESAFKKDHKSAEISTKDQVYAHNMYALFNKAQFCPTENNGEIKEEQLEQWIEEYKQIMVKNDQQSLFSSTLGRLLSFSPLGADGHEPCEAVRKIIEKYGDDKMISNYQIAVYNRRGVFTSSAGNEELKMAESFKSNAEYLQPLYPKTAQIFQGLYQTYQREAERERMDAENGLY